MLFMAILANLIKGAIGAGIDPYIGYGQKEAFAIEHCMQAIMELFPCFSRARMLGWVELSMYSDACPIIKNSPKYFISIVVGVPVAWRQHPVRDGFAHTLATTAHHRAPSLDRFSSGALIDEHGVAVAH